MQEQTSEQLRSIVLSRYIELDNKRQVEISPSYLAEATYAHIDPSSLSPHLVKLAAILELRQLARRVCREHHAESEYESESGNLFDFKLQPRYPVTRTEEDGPVYVLRECMSFEEREENIRRLRRESEAKLTHADALEAETQALVRSGRLTHAEA